MDSKICKNNPGKSTRSYTWEFYSPLASNGRKLFTLTPNTPVTKVVNRLIGAAESVRSNYTGAALRRLELSHEQWSVQMLWVVQMEDHCWTAQQWPFTLHEVLLEKDEAECRFLQLKMAQILHDHLEAGWSQYADAWEQWQFIEEEEFSLCEDLSKKGLNPTSREVRDCFAEIRKSLKKRKNPWTKKYQMHTWNLFEAVLKVIRAKIEGKSFQDGDKLFEALNPLYHRYVKAFSRMEKLLRGEGEHPIHLLYQEGEYLYKKGNRRNLEQIYPEKKEMNSITWRSGRGRKPK